MKEMVVKDNKLINASINLELTEQRLLLIAIVNARETEQGITSDTAVEIKASDYASRFNVSLNTAYGALKDAVSNLFDRKFTYTQLHHKTKKLEVVRSRWVSRISYVDDSALLSVTFAPDVVPMISRLEKCFTQYDLSNTSNLTSKYALRLYELLIQWREVKKTPIFELEDFRSKLGLEPNDYPAMNNFKNRVLEPALKQINEHTDIKVTYEQEKSGRVITGFKFKFKFKPQPTAKNIQSAERDPNTVDMFRGMTDKQINFFANKLSQDDEFGAKYSEPGESYADLEERLRVLLSDPKNVQKWSKHLERVGFKA